MAIRQSIVLNYYWFQTILSKDRTKWTWIGVLAVHKFTSVLKPGIKSRESNAKLVTKRKRGWKWKGRQKGKGKGKAKWKANGIKNKKINFNLNLGQIYDLIMGQIIFSSPALYILYIDLFLLLIKEGGKIKV